MTRWTNLLAAGCLAVLGLGQGPAQAAEITVTGGMGVISGLRDLAAGFQSATGNKVNAVFDANPLAKVNAGAGGDIVALNPPVIDDLIKSGKIVGTRVDFARAGIGVAVKAGAGKLDLSTVDAFKRAMLAAKSIGHTKVGTGPFNTRLFQKLGIYDQIKDRIKIIEGRLVAEAVAAGDIEIGIQQTNVIQPVAGTEYLGPLPPELMEYGRVGVGLLTASKQPEVASAFIKFMADPATAALLKKGDMEPPLH